MPEPSWRGHLGNLCLRPETEVHYLWLLSHWQGRLWTQSLCSNIQGVTLGPVSCLTSASNSFLICKMEVITDTLSVWGAFHKTINNCVRPTHNKLPINVCFYTLFSAGFLWSRCCLSASWFYKEIQSLSHVRPQAFEGFPPLSPWDAHRYESVLWCPLEGDAGPQTGDCVLQGTAMAGHGHHFSP